MRSIRNLWNRRLRDRRRGYTAEDMAMVRLKIAAGLTPEQANLTYEQRTALLDIPDEEIIRLGTEGR